jgi:hypothetical protein
MRAFRTKEVCPVARRAIGTAAPLAGDLWEGMKSAGYAWLPVKWDNIASPNHPRCGQNVRLVPGCSIQTHKARHFIEWHKKFGEGLCAHLM